MTHYRSVLNDFLKSLLSRRFFDDGKIFPQYSIQITYSLFRLPMLDFHIDESSDNINSIINLMINEGNTVYND